MRIIGSFENEHNAQRLSLYLKKEGIENTLEPQMEMQTENFTYQIWVHNEDCIEKAYKIFNEFSKDTKNKKYDVSIKEVFPEEEKKPYEDVVKEPPITPKPVFYKLTSFFLAICVFIFIVNLFQERAIIKKDPETKYVLMTPIKYYLLFDIPHDIIELQKFLEKNHIDMYKKLEDQPLDVREELIRINNMPVWKGFYDVLLLKLKNPSSPWQFSGTFFEKIRQGQVWRLVSPCFLHTQFFHIFFNMIWLLILGKQIEQCLSKFKYFLLVIIIGIISNIFQYLISGPSFLGYSGVVMGLIAFIWVRQRIAPWEGYTLQKGVFIFLGFFVLAMLGLQIFSFFMQVWKKSALTLNIANTAHIVGAISGAVLGKFSFFSRKSNER